MHSKQIMNQGCRKMGGGFAAGRRPAMLSKGVSALLGLWAVLMPLTVHAEAIGQFTVVAGSVDALREAAQAPIPAEVGMGSFMQDVVRTKHRSRTQLKFVDNSVLNMGPNYVVEIKEYLFDADKQVRKGVLSTLRGEMRATVAKVGDTKNSSFEVETPTAVAAARGTDFFVRVLSSLETEVVVLEGIVAVRNINPGIKGFVLIRAGQGTRVRKNAPPTPPFFVPPGFVQLLIKRTTPTNNPPTGSTLLTWADWVPIPQPPKFVPPPKPRPRPPLIRPQPPVTPPGPTTTPSLLTVPVNLVLVF